MPKPKKHTQAFWDALVRRGVTPEQVAPHLPAMCEFEIAAEMVKAKQRVDEEAQEAKLRGDIFAGGKPRHLRERQPWCPPGRKHSKAR